MAQALGVHGEPINAIDPARYRDGACGKGLEALWTTWVEGGRSVGAGRPSLLQDVLKGRRTEINYLNGLVDRNGRDAGIPTLNCRFNALLPHAFQHARRIFSSSAMRPRTPLREPPAIDTNTGIHLILRSHSYDHGARHS